MRPVNHESSNTTLPCVFRGNEFMGSANKAVMNESGVFTYRQFLSSSRKEGLGYVREQCLMADERYRIEGQIKLTKITVTTVNSKM